MASPEQVAAFQSKVDELGSADGELSIDVSSLPGMDALDQPGEKTGDTKLINNNSKAEVYQTGDAVVQAPKGGSVMGQLLSQEEAELSIPAHLLNAYKVHTFLLSASRPSPVQLTMVPK